MCQFMKNKACTVVLHSGLCPYHTLPHHHCHVPSWTNPPEIVPRSYRLLHPPALTRKEAVLLGSLVKSNATGTWTSLTFLSENITGTMGYGNVDFSKPRSQKHTFHYRTWLCCYISESCYFHETTLYFRSISGFGFWFTFLYLSHCSVLPKNIVKKNSKCCKWYLASLWSVTQFYLSHHVYIMFAKLYVGKYSILVAIRLDGSHLCGSNTLLIWNWIWKQVKVQIAFLLTTVCMDQSNDCNNSVWVHVCASVL